MLILDLFNPFSWGNTDEITFELSRIALVIQVFAVGVELPKKYMKLHWRSVFILLGPVMIIGWMVTSAFVYGLFPNLNWVDSMVVGACVTATDPVLASSVVGKSKFAQRVPGHIRNVLSAESGSNDGMAFPFLFLGIYLIIAPDNSQAALDWFLYAILYTVCLSVVIGALVGRIARLLIKFSEKKNLIDRESFIVFYLVLAIFNTGICTLLGTDDLLAAFTAGCAFAWDGAYAKKTEDANFSNVIDVLINMSFFVYFGAVVPWQMFNMPSLGLDIWRLIVLAILVLLFRRIPALLMLKPFIPDVRTWREALFCGHFGPIGVGAIFISLLGRAELENGTEEPSNIDSIDNPSGPNYLLIQVIWPITTFLVISSIVIHGSSVFVFMLGKRINALTMTLTRDDDDNPHWLARLPRLELGQSLSISRSRRTSVDTSNSTAIINEEEKSHQQHKRRRRNKKRRNILEPGETAYQEGGAIIIEDADGEVIKRINTDPDNPNYGKIHYLSPNEIIGKGITHQRIGELRRTLSPHHERHESDASDIEDTRSVTNDNFNDESFENLQEPDIGLRVNTNTSEKSNVTEYDDRVSRSEMDEETAVERRRRLAALGISAERSPERQPETTADGFVIPTISIEAPSRAPGIRFGELPRPDYSVSTTSGTRSNTDERRRSSERPRSIHSIHSIHK